ncbi:hypothetical protein [Saccharicrinis aurantiacus]|uniref:hypothetical protein n=1 Tax=Saccharicrinis aurantiacus TaxID=1849719 RepID=UPI00094F6974|nr:hypothetical protein [Saccharicrinis aurantiacus]
MIKNIYFVDRPTFNQDFYTKFEFDKLIQFGYNVKFLNLTSLLKGAEFETEIPEHLKEHVLFFKTKNNVKHFIKKKSTDSIVITLCPFIPSSAWLYYAIFITKMRYIVLNLNVYPDFCKTPNKKLDSVKRSVKRLNFKKLLNKPISEIYYNLGKLSLAPADIAIHSKESLKWQNKKLTAETTEDIYSVGTDYSQSMDLTDRAIIDEPYAVFVDQYFCHHIDFKSHQILHSFTAKEYYTLLNKFLHKFSDESGLKVVIACHPRRCNYQLNDFDKRFELFFNLTPKLIKDSDFVLQHFSTAISFTVIFNKPFLLLDSKMFADGTIGKKISGFARYFNKETVSMDDYESYSHEDSVVDSDIYNNYINTYLKHPKASTSLSFSNIIINITKSLKDDKL